MGWMLLLTSGMSLAAADEPTLTFLETDPAATATLGREEPFYLRFEVNNTAPVGVMVDAYYRGEPVLYGLGTDGILQVPAGGGTLVTHFFYWSEHHTPIDEVRLYVGDTKNPLSGKAFSLPVKLVWSGQAAKAREPAPWVKAWLQNETARAQQAANSQDAASKTSAAPLTISILAGLLAVLGLLFWGWRARQRAAAAPGEPLVK